MIALESPNRNSSRDVRGNLMMNNYQVYQIMIVSRNCHVSLTHVSIEVE